MSNHSGFFALARYDAAGGSDSRNVQISSHIITTKLSTLNFYKLNAIPTTQPTVSEHLRHKL